VAPAIPPPVSYTKRGHAHSVESDRKEEPALPVRAPDRRRAATASGVSGFTGRSEPRRTVRPVGGGAISRDVCVCVCVAEHNSEEHVRSREGERRAPLVRRSQRQGQQVRDSGKWCFFLLMPFFSPPHGILPPPCFSLPEVPAASPSPSPGATISSARPRHVKSMSASGHPMKSCLPPIDDNAEYQR